MNQETEKRLSQKVRTGIPGLDAILKGGLLNSGVYIVRGTPGAGKTTLASQICFNHAAEGGKVLFTTVLSESHVRLIQHLRSFDFFSEKDFTEKFVLLSTFSILESEGPSAVVKLLSREIQRRGATMLVLDGMSNIDDSVNSDREIKKFIHELQGYAIAVGCTMLLLTSGSRELSSPEYTMADGLIDLELSTINMRTERLLHVRKMRGTDILSGRHFYRITDRGISVFPRLETLFQVPFQQPVDPWFRMSTGAPGLDTMIGGGLPQASTTLLLGASGAGKTTLGLQFLSRATEEEPGLFFGFYEQPEAIKAKAASVGIDLASHLDAGTLELIWHPPYGQILDALAERLLENVRRRKVRRLFIDGLGGFERTAFFAERIQPTISALTNALRSLGVATIYSWETDDLVGMEIRPPHNEVSTLIDNLLMLRYVEIDSAVRRLISVLKMRNSEFDCSIRHFDINGSGIEIGERFSRAEHLLKGSADRKAPIPRHAEGRGAV